MKKLLALILCVMLFVSVIPTAAFAAEGASYDGWLTTKESKDAISAAKKGIENSYAALAADQGVFSTVKALDGIVVSLSKGFFADLEDGATLRDPKTDKDVDFSQDALIDGTKAYLRSVIGSEIMTELNKKSAKFIDKDGHVVAAKWMDAFATAASKSLTSAKAQKALEDMMYELAFVQADKALKDGWKDLKDEMIDWSADNTKFWNTYFGKDSVDGMPRPSRYVDFEKLEYAPTPWNESTNDYWDALLKANS